MNRSLPIWIADLPDYTQGQEGWVEGDVARAEVDGRSWDGRGGCRANGGEEPGTPSHDDASDAMRALRARIEEVGKPKERSARVVLGDGMEDGGGIALRFGAVHEWFQVDWRGGEAGRIEAGGRAPQGVTSARCGSRATRSHHWTPPLTLLAGIACEAMRSGGATRLVWIGRRVFPYPVFLARLHPSWLAASLFVDARERDARVWAMDVALRSEVPTCVVGDGQGLTLAESRRLQVAAKSGKGMALLARPEHEMDELSAAATRWVVTPRVGMGVGGDQRIVSHEMGVVARVAWTLTLVRSKGELLCMDARSLIAEWRDAQGFVVVPAMVAGRADRKTADAAS